MSAKLRAKGRLDSLAKSRAQTRVKALLARLAKERQARQRAETKLVAIDPCSSRSADARHGRAGRRPIDIFERLARHIQRVRGGDHAGPIPPERIASVVNGGAKDEYCWLWDGRRGPLGEDAHIEVGPGPARCPLRLRCRRRATAASHCAHA